MVQRCKERFVTKWHQKYLQIEAEIPLGKFLNVNFDFLLQLKFSQTLLLNHDGANLFDPC